MPIPDVEVIVGAVGGRIVGHESSLELKGFDSDPGNDVLRQTFSIRNNGTGNLNISEAIQVSGPVTATNVGRNILSPGQRTTFDVIGSKQELTEATIGVKTDDPDTPEYEFKIQGDVVQLGDVNLDSRFTVEDIDLIRDTDSLLGVALLAADVDANGTVNEADVQSFVEELVGTHLGDLDLIDGVQFSDFLMLSDNFGQAGGWAQGDIDGDGNIGFADFLLLSANFGKTPTVATIVGQIDDVFAALDEELLTDELSLI